MKNKIVVFSLIALMLLGISGCRSGSNEAEDTDINTNQLSSMDEFAASSFKALINAESNENYSPVSLYFALALASEGSSGAVREEFDKVLKTDKNDDLSKNLASVMKSLQTKDEKSKESKLVIANSIWLDSNYSFATEYKKIVKNSYNSELFSVKMGSRDTNSKMSKWVKDKTEGLVELPMNTEKETVLSLINTIYFKDSWMESFKSEENTSENFTLADGSNVKAEYLNKKFRNKDYYKGKNFSAVSLDFSGGSKMKFILPDENTTLKDIVGDSENVFALLGKDATKKADINVKVPKFKIKSKLDLKDMLKSIGLSGAFEPNNNGFDKMVESESDLYISDILQKTYISVDEKGVEAAAVTQAMMEKTAIDEEDREEIDFHLNRPFMYIIEKDGIILFAGVVVNPAK